jgi:hypothetical protein
VPVLDTSNVTLAFSAVFVIVAVGTLLTTVLNARAERRHARRVAAEERAFNLRRDLYADVVEYLQLLEMWMTRTHPMFTPSPDPPELPTDEAAARCLSARLIIFGSPDMKNASKSFMDGFAGQGARRCPRAVRR